MAGLHNVYNKLHVIRKANLLTKMNVKRMTQRTEDICTNSYLNTVFTSLQNYLLKSLFASRILSKAGINCKSSPAFHNTSSLVSWAVLLQVSSWPAPYSLAGLSLSQEIWSNQMNLHSLPPEDAVQEEEEYQRSSVVLEVSLTLNSQMGDGVEERGRWKWSHFHEASADGVLIQGRVRCEGHLTGGIANPV